MRYEKSQNLPKSASKASTVLYGFLGQGAFLGTASWNWATLEKQVVHIAGGLAGGEEATGAVLTETHCVVVAAVKTLVALH